MNNSLIVDYFKRTGRLPRKKEYRFADPNLKSALPIAFKMTPARAVEYLKKKGENIIPTDSWDELDSEAHDKAFTVAKVASADLLQTIFDHVEKAKTSGQTLKQFREDLLPKLEQAGWAGATPSRLKVIYETNMQMAYAQGQYKQNKLIADIFPYWIYHQVERKNKRHEHSSLNGKKFRHDDPIWVLIHPPSAFGCGCWVEPTKDATGVENGADLMAELEKSDEFQISPLKAWQPDTEKYVEGIKSKLEEMLNQKNDINGGLPDCDGLLFVSVSKQTFSSKKCIKILPDQKSWKEYNRPKLSEIPEEIKLPRPDLLQVGETKEDAQTILSNALGLKPNQDVTIETPNGTIKIKWSDIKHITEKRGEKREQFGNYILPTLESPYEIYEVEYEDGIRNHYIAVFKGDATTLCVIRINKDGSLLYNVIRSKGEKLNSKRIGKLLYGL